MEPVGHDGLNFEPGQYAWFTLGDTPLSLQQHPFSIASAANSRQLCISANAVGDFTKSLKSIETGTKAWIEGPFGSFVPDPDPNVSLFLVAGGIGITPMMSMLRTFQRSDEKRRIILLYANPDLDRASFAGELERLEQELNLDVVHVLEEPPEDWLVGHAASSVILRATVLVRIKARFAGNGCSLSKKRNAESRRHSGSQRAAAQALWAAFRSLELAMASPALARLAHNACATAECYRTGRMAH